MFHRTVTGVGEHEVNSESSFHKMREATVETTQAVQRRLQDDISQHLETFRISFEHDENWIGAESDSPRTDDKIICHLDGWSFPVQTSEGAELALVQVAERLQDLVMRELSRPWPYQEPVTLLPALSGSGTAVWTDDQGTVVIPIGSLSEHGSF